MWTVDQDNHHTVTVEFYDREFHRDFHFTDPYLYDKACLSMYSGFVGGGVGILTDYRRAWNAILMSSLGRKSGDDIL